ncbi:MAG: SprT family zinc-dependent metalloprotease [Bdellovibrionota bacterium]
MKSSQSLEFKFASWPVRVQRKAFRRRMTISLSLDGPILVKTGILTSQHSIESFLESKKNWLKKHLENYEKMKDQIPSPVLKQGEIFPFQGRKLKLQCVLTLNKKPFMSVHEDQLLLHVPQSQWSANSRQEIYPCPDLLLKFYEKEARAWIHEKVNVWSQQMQLYPKKIKFRAPKTRWGSCSSQKILNFNWKLIVFNSQIVDYVIIHELAHLRHLNHSKSFWQLVEKYCPHFEVQEKELKMKYMDSYFLKSGKRL